MAQSPEKRLILLTGKQMMKSRKSWREKMDNPNLPKLVDVPPRMQKRLGSGTMLLPSPGKVDAFIRTVQKGNLTTVSQIRRALAQQYAVHCACPLLTGMFVRIAAEAAEEDGAAGKTKITPYWRVLRDDGSLNPKFPGGVRHQAELLRNEGHTILNGRGGLHPRIDLTQSFEDR